jgi:hypothetical protein
MVTQLIQQKSVSDDQQKYQFAAQNIQIINSTAGKSIYFLIDDIVGRGN